MMPGHGANPIFFNKKIKIGRPEHLIIPPPPQHLHPTTSHLCQTELSLSAFSLFLSPLGTILETMTVLLPVFKELKMTKKFTLSGKILSSAFLKERQNA